MTDKIHQLRITPLDDNRGVWLTSNGRTWFMTHSMLVELHNATGEAIMTGKEWRNYEDPKPSPIPYSSPASATLEDLI